MAKAKAKTNELLRSARLANGWTPEFVCGQVGVSRGTYMRWEAGIQIPRVFSLDALCRVFHLSPAALGFGQYVLFEQRIQKRRDHAYAGQMEQQQNMPPGVILAPTDESAASKWSALLASGQTVSGMLKVVNRMAQDTDTDEELAPRALEEALVTWSRGLASCWQWYMAGGQKELEQLVPTYIPRLIKPALNPGPHQRTAASLISQVYQLIALLDLQRTDFGVAQNNGTQALIYAQLARDWNVFVAAQLRLAQIYSTRKRIGSALSAYNDALRCVNSDTSNVSPLLHSWIFGGLAEIQAAMGREVEALQFIQLASAVFPEHLRNDDYISYIQCDRSLLYLYRGLVLLRLGQARQAWDAFALVDELKPAPPERVRADFLRYRTYTSIMLGNMIQSCIYLEAAARAALAIASDLTLSEIYGLYEHMLVIWGQEPRVRALAMLFQQ